MIKQDFPSCCAGLLLYNFGGTTRTNGQKTKPNDADIRRFLKDADVGLRINKGFALLTLNNEQNEFMKPFMDKFGYECVGKDIISPNHSGSTIFIYLKANKKE